MMVREFVRHCLTNSIFFIIGNLKLVGQFLMDDGKRLVLARFLGCPKIQALRKVLDKIFGNE